MNKKNIMSYDANIEQKSVAQFAEHAYLNYSMYVILDRALPHISDGLKPVQRRIVYAMSELGLNNTSSPKKSARTIGDVLGKYHPHGDSACYEAMVAMAQYFSFLYPLVEGQGNWGSPDDPKSFAAMRYTESKLSSYTNLLIDDLSAESVDWQLNFDGSLNEPQVLPAKVPNILLNGASGIAVGMSTNIPSHNLKEVLEATIHLIRNPNSAIKDLCKYILGPDFATNANIIATKQELLDIYESGKGSIKMRATYKINNDIIITALPHQVSGSKVVEQIAQQIQDKKLTLIQDVRDESDHENPTRLVIVPRSKKIDKKELMAHLFATTDLERNYKINFNMIGLNNKPQVKNLKLILSEWIAFRRDIIIKKLSHRVLKIKERLHILSGLLLVFNNLDVVLNIIRDADEPKIELIKKLKLTEIQAESVLNLKLRSLAKLEEKKLITEQRKLNIEQNDLEQILSSERKLKNLMCKELEQISKKFSITRQAKILSSTKLETKAFDINHAITVENITVILSAKGWIRTAKGINIDPEQMNYKVGDSYLTHANGKNNAIIVISDTQGRSYNILANTLPSPRSIGEPLISKIALAAGAQYNGLFFLEPQIKQQILWLFDLGYGLITDTESLQTRNKKGKLVLKVSENGQALAPIKLKENDEFVALITNVGRMLIADIKQIPFYTKGKGVKLINLHKDELIKFCVVINEQSKGLYLHTEKKKTFINYEKLTDYMSSLKTRGKILPKGFTKLVKVVVK